MGHLHPWPMNPQICGRAMGRCPGQDGTDSSMDDARSFNKLAHFCRVTTVSSGAFSVLQAFNRRQAGCWVQWSVILAQGASYPEFNSQNSPLQQQINPVCATLLAKGARAPGFNSHCNLSQQQKRILSVCDTRLCWKDMCLTPWKTLLIT